MRVKPRSWHFRRATLHWSATHYLNVRVFGKLVQGEADGGARRVVALEHEGVHLLLDVGVRQVRPLLIGQEQLVQEGDARLDAVLGCEQATRLQARRSYFLRNG